MSLSSHLAELRRKHQALSLKIEESLKHPSVDDLVITELKRQKLQLKDEMERLSHQAQPA